MEQDIVGAPSCVMVRGIFAFMTQPATLVEVVIARAAIMAIVAGLGALFAVAEPADEDFGAGDDHAPAFVVGVAYWADERAEVMDVSAALTDKPVTVACGWEDLWILGPSTFSDLGMAVVGVRTLRDSKVSIIAVETRKEKSYSFREKKVVQATELVRTGIPKKLLTVPAGAIAGGTARPNSSHLSMRSA